MKRIEFCQVCERFERYGWKLLLRYRQYALFVKPADPNEPPRWVQVYKGMVAKDELDAVMPDSSA